MLSRRHRQAPLDRLQAVDIVQPLVGRVLGLSRLTLEVAGAGDSKIELAFLADAQARTLRNHLLAAAAGLRSDSDRPTAGGRGPRARGAHGARPTAGRVDHAVLGDDLGAAHRRWRSWWRRSWSATQGSIALAVPFLFGSVTLLWNRLSGGFGFRVASAADGVRLRHGLLEQRTQTVPPGRVQAVRLSQPFCWRIAGWWMLEVNVAGYGAGGSSDGSVHTSTLLPVGTRDEALTVLSFVLPELEVAEDAAHRHPRGRRFPAGADPRPLGRPDRLATSRLPRRRRRAAVAPRCVPARARRRAARPHPELRRLAGPAPATARPRLVRTPQHPRPDRPQGRTPRQRRRRRPPRRPVRPRPHRPHHRPDHWLTAGPV